jgi:hypothetical protein
VTYFIHTDHESRGAGTLLQNGRPFQEIKQASIQLFADFRGTLSAGIVTGTGGDTASPRKL